MTYRRHQDQPQPARKNEFRDVCNSITAEATVTHNATGIRHATGQRRRRFNRLPLKKSIGFRTLTNRGALKVILYSQGSLARAAGGRNQSGATAATCQRGGWAGECVRGSDVVVIMPGAAPAAAHQTVPNIGFDAVRTAVNRCSQRHSLTVRVFASSRG